MSARVTLSAGPLTVVLAPTIGGAVARFECDGQPLFRRAPDDASHVLDMGCFPLVPFSNRVRGGRFTCNGREVVLAPNSPPDPSPLHGQGWLSGWEVAEAAGTHAQLRFRHAAGEWPWDYEAVQDFALDPDGLSLTLTCTNLSPERMPCGLAFHPYHPCDAQTVLDTGVSEVWTIDANTLPVAREPATGRYSLKQRKVCAQGLDHGFEGWNGRATIDWGTGRTLTMTSPDAGRMQIYSPSEGNIFVCEPVQNANAALNASQDEWAALGLTMLEQGERHAVHARFAVG